MKKKCTRCRRRRPLTEFCRNRHSRDGRHWWCRACTSRYKRLYVLTSKVWRAYRERWLAANHDKTAAHARASYQRMRKDPARLAHYRRVKAAAARRRYWAKLAKLSLLGED